MARILAFGYALLAYVFFLIAILWAIAFLGGWGVVRSIDEGLSVAIGEALTINVLLLLAFAVQHCVMARPGFKRWWTTLIPTPIERSTFVLLASLLLILLFRTWRPMPGVVWEINVRAGRAILTVLSLCGWVLVFYSSFLIDHFDLFGLKQAYCHLRHVPYHHPRFAERSLYRFVRHPLMLGFLIAFWSTPTMTHGRLLFAALTTLFILFAIQLEERDLLSMLGEEYRAYRQRTPMLLFRGGGRRDRAVQS